MTSARRIVTPALLGGWGALLAWTATRIGPPDGIETWLARLRPAVDLTGEATSRMGLLGVLVGLCQCLATIRNTPRMLTDFRPSRLAWGLAAGVVCVVLSILLERFAAPHWLRWVIVGASAGTIDGLLNGSRRSILTGLVGGSLGGLFGGLLVLQMPHWVADRPWSIAALDATCWAVAGGLIGAGAALARLATCPAWVRVQSGPRAGLVVPMDRPIFFIGSDPKNDLQLSTFDGRASEPFHARILRSSGVFKVKSTCSSPTYVDRDQVHLPRPLPHEATINIAGQAVVFRLHPLLRTGSDMERDRNRNSPASAIDHPIGTPVSARPPLVASVRGASERVQQGVATRDAAPGDVDDPDDDSTDPSRGRSGITASSEAEIAEESVAPCDNCHRRYFGAPGKRYCDHCLKWF